MCKYIFHQNFIRILLPIYFMRGRLSLLKKTQYKICQNTKQHKSITLSLFFLSFGLGGYNSFFIYRDANSLVLSDDLIVVVILAKQVEEEELVEAVTVVSQNIKKVAISKYATIYLEARGKNDM